MAENLKEHTIEWVILGLLLFALLSFAIYFTYYNAESTNSIDGLGNMQEVQESLQSNLISVEQDSNTVLNITSYTNPEESQLGSQDSVATSYEQIGTAKKFFTTAKFFFSWVLTGTVGQIILSVFTGLFGFISVYLIIKSVRNGL